MAYISDLVDSLQTFPSSSELTILEGAVEVDHQLRLNGLVQSTNLYDFDSVFVRINHTQTGSGYYFGMSMVQQSPDPIIVITGRSMGMTIVSVSSVKTLQLTWAGYTWISGPTPAATGGTASNGYYRIPYDSVNHSYLRMTNAAAGASTVISFLASADGISWDVLFTFVSAVDTITLSGTSATYQYRLTLGDYNSITLADNLNIVADPWTDPVPYPDYTTKPPRAPRTFLPTAVAPAKTKTCESLLDLVREFSASVRKAVRIVGDSTIEMVNPDDALPTGFDSSHGAHYYSSTTTNVTAAAVVLSLQKGDMDLSADAGMVNNDIGIIEGGFRIPQRMPFPGLDPAPVSTVRYTFTPEQFTASISLTYPDVPLAVRER